MIQEWKVLRTKGNHEQKVAGLLEMRKITAYLPLRQEVRNWSDRRKRVSFPLFPNYIFVQPRDSEIEQLKFLPGSCGLLVHGKRFASCPEKIVKDIRTLESSRMRFESHPIIHPGEKVIVVTGPLAGLTGHLSRIKNQDRFVLNAEILNQSVSIEIDRQVIRLA